MAEPISITPTINAIMLTEDDLLSDEEVAEVLKTIPEETLAEYASQEGEDVPETDLTEEVEPVTRMQREGYTITNKADYYYFAHRKWSGRGGKKPIRVVWHHMAGNLTVRQFMAIMQSSRQMSPTVSIHTDGTVYAWVPEEMRPWTTGSYAADQQALTFELANDQVGGQWHISDKVIDLAAQIHAEWSKRYGIPTTYSYRGAGINMHKDWAATACPGPYLEGLIKNGTITKKINAYLNPPAPAPTPTPKPSVKSIYRVQVGAFKVRQNAVKLAKKLNDAGYKTVIKTENGYVKVQTGAFAVKANADKMLAELKAKGYPALIVEVKA
ncbi:MAG: SPOR domain-containing protein [Solobacterium sp.]|nr:SPOR domain-containing protein [Solobacterium sp.]